MTATEKALTRISAAVESFLSDPQWKTNIAQHYDELERANTSAKRALKQIPPRAKAKEGKLEFYAVHEAFFNNFEKAIRYKPLRDIETEKAIAQLAREQLGYAAGTADRDILYSILVTVRKTK